MKDLIRKIKFLIKTGKLCKGKCIRCNHWFRCYEEVIERK